MMSDQAQSDAQPDEYPSETYAWYVMGVLVVTYAFSYVDRTILTLLVQPIKTSLGLSDIEVSLLHGLAFAVFYTLLGMPIGWLADRGNRIRIISVGVFLWSLATAACGLTSSFWQMFAARVLVGVGEATLSPSAYSMVTDYFRPDKLARALSVYNTGLFVGSGMALVIGGAVIEFTPPLDLPVVGHLEPWQVTFLFVGLPAVVLGLWMLTLREPKRIGATPGDDRHGIASHVGRALAYMRTQPKAYLYIGGGYSFYAFIWTGTSAWIPTYFIRTFGWSPGEVGARYGVIVLVFGILGVMSGGMLAGRLRHRFNDAEIRTGMIGVLCTLPFGVLAPLAPNSTLALVGFAGLTFFTSFPWGAATASLQLITPNRLRAMVSAVFLFVVNLAGIGIAPTAVAFITDVVFGYDEAVKYSISIAVAIAAPISAVLLYKCLAPYRVASEAIATGRA